MKKKYYLNPVKTIFLSIAFQCVIFNFSFAQPFITTWKTNIDQFDYNSTITIPTHPNETYNYDVDWDNDGVFDEFGITGDVSHDFGTRGTYTIAIQGTFPRIYFNENPNAPGASKNPLRIIAVNQWGSNIWTSMENAFWGCENLTIQASDIPDLSLATSLSGMFYGVWFDDDIGNWNVSNITDMSYMFCVALFFNQDISSWDVSNVTNMSWMFASALYFDQDIGNWDVSNVIDMDFIFLYADNFNQNLGNWDITKASVSGMLCRSKLDTDNYENTLAGWESQGITNKNLDADWLRYCNDSIRTRLINVYGWTINGDYKNCFPINSENQLQLNAFEIYPNPTQGQLNIDIELDKPLNDIWLEIVSVQGQILKKLYFDKNQTRIQEQLDLTDLMSGNYYLVLHHNQNITVKMITLN